MIITAELNGLALATGFTFLLWMMSGEPGFAVLALGSGVAFAVGRHRTSRALLRSR